MNKLRLRIAIEDRIKSISKKDQEMAKYFSDGDYEREQLKTRRRELRWVLRTMEAQ